MVQASKGEVKHRWHRRISQHDVGPLQAVVPISRQFWKGGKDEMVNMPLGDIRNECVLMQIDSDEIWKPEQLVKIVEQFKSNVFTS